MGRQPCCDKIGLKRGPWTIEEDHRLMTFILNNGIQCWRLVPKLAGLLRCGKSCRLRWINYLRPDLKRGAFSEMEENQMIELDARLGNRWSKIASHFPGRTDNEIKNHWNTKIKKRLKLQGINPLTHQPLQQNDAVKQNMIVPNFYQAENAAKDIDHANESNTTSHLIDNYGKMSKNSENLISEETNPASCYSPATFSFGDSVSSYQKQSTGESTVSIHQEQWVESVDSMMLWDGINHIDQYLLFSGLMQ